jgi:hypothetical protein
MSRKRKNGAAKNCRGDFTGEIDDDTGKRKVIKYRRRKGFQEPLAPLVAFPAYF